MASSPRIITQTGAVRHWSSKKGPSPVHRPSACSGVKALRNTSDARRQAAIALLAFRSLDPLRALREPDRRRRDEKRPFPLRTKNCQHNPKQPLDRKSPIQVTCESVIGRLSHRKKGPNTKINVARRDAADSTQCGLGLCGGEENPIVLPSLFT